jgi:hypothetical protein
MAPRYSSSPDTPARSRVRRPSSGSERTSDGFRQNGRVINSRLNCTTRMITFEVTCGPPVLIGSSDPAAAQRQGTTTARPMILPACMSAPMMTTAEPTPPHATANSPVTSAPTKSRTTVAPRPRVRLFTVSAACRGGSVSTIEPLRSGPRAKQAWVGGTCGRCRRMTEVRYRLDDNRWKTIKGPVRLLAAPLHPSVGPSPPNTICPELFRVARLCRP